MKMIVWSTVIVVIGVFISIPSQSSEEIEIVEPFQRQFDPKVRPDLYADCCLRPGLCVKLMCKNVCDSKGGTRVSNCSECKRSQKQK